ncbi:MAG: phage/plasmid primase, P4 family [Pyrobaculum sp.]
MEQNTTAGDNNTPFVNIVNVEQIVLAKNEAWFKIFDKLLVIRFTKGGIEIAVVGDRVETVYVAPGGEIDCRSTSIVVDDVDICSEVSYIISNYETLMRQYELVERAKAAKLLNYSTVPRLPTEYERVIGALTSLILSRRIIKTFYTDSNEIRVIGIYCYNAGYYKECEDLLNKEIFEIIQDSKLLDLRAVPQLRGSVIRNIADKTMTEYKPAKRCLLFRDKVFCWDKFMKTGDIEATLIDPSPDLIVTHRIPWHINVELLKRRPGLLKFIPPESIDQLITLFRELAPKSFTAFYSWVKKHEDDEEDVRKRIVTLLELIGYVLYPHDYPLHKATLLVGKGANGKSTYLQLIRTVVGSENVASVNMTELDPAVNRFAVSNLVNKLVNISSEPYRSKVFDATRFKELTGEDVVLIDRKNRDPINYRNYAKLIFAANELPQVTEDTYAFWRRWIVIEFPNQFTPDPAFFERTFTQEEIEAIILLSIYAFRLVLVRKAFAVEQSMDMAQTAREEWLNRTNPIYKVVKRMVADGVIEFASDAFVIKTDLYELYKKYVEIMREEEDVTVLAQKDFTVHLTRLFPVRVGSARVDGKKRHVYWGVRLKDHELAKSLIGRVETPQSLF